MAEPRTIRYAQALAMIAEAAAGRGLLPSELVSLDGGDNNAPNTALGRTLAEDLMSRESLPHYDNSAVDGFAVRSAEVAALLATGPARLRVAGRVVAGDRAPSCALESGVCWEIMTGAPFPLARSRANAYDSSVKVEDVEVVRDASQRAIEVVLHEAPDRGDAVRPAGEDFRPGQKALSAGTRLAPQHLMGAAALGANKLAVRRRPRVAIVSTGCEVVDAGGAVEPGQVRNSTLPYLKAELARLGCEVPVACQVGDDPRDLWRALERALAVQPDVVITTGGVSMGIYDHVGTVAADLGAKPVFHRVAIRPGKPILFSEFGGQGPVLFGLPGNPLSTVVGLRFFIEPFLRARLGRRLESPVKARLAARAGKPEGLRCFFKARWSIADEDGRSAITVLRGQPSFMISPLLEANAWAVLPEDAAAVAEGELIDVFPLLSDETGGFAV